LSVYPKGDSRAKESLSCFLKLHSSHSIFFQRKVYVEFKLSIKNQFGMSHREHKDNAWMGGSVNGWGFANFIPLKDLQDMSKGFAVLDAVIFEVEITAISEIKYGV
ncbi:TRAF-like family protein, partial [Corchorus capsularis]